MNTAIAVGHKPLPCAQFWAGKRVLVTGHTGFKGAWLTLWLKRLGASVIGMALPPMTMPSLYASAEIDLGKADHRCDIRDSGSVAAIVREASPDIVFHLAAQALVGASYADPLGTIATNTQGTANLLDAMRGVPSVRAVVVITTDKVYENREWSYPYRENDALGGHDAYSASKAAAEILTACYRDAFLRGQGTAVATARAGNVIGGGDWAKDRIIPDAVRAWGADGELTVRRPSAVRPWQHVLEPLAGYLRLAELMCADPAIAGPYNFGPEPSDVASVRNVVERAQQFFGKGSTAWNSTSETPFHETGTLTLEIAHAKTKLGFVPRWSLQQAIERTMRWYSAFDAGTRAHQLCMADIEAYEAS